MLCVTSTREIDGSWQDGRLAPCQEWPDVCLPWSPVLPPGLAEANQLSADVDDNLWCEKASFCHPGMPDEEKEDEEREIKKHQH